jgi:N-acetylmuramoyl-L-alanine amidase
MLDPGHGLPEDPGAMGAFGLTEAEVCWRIALGCRRILEQRGVEVVFSREEGETIPEGERSQRANQQEVDCLLSIHLNSSRDMQAEGATCFYFSNGRWYSKAGKKAAHLIQDELVGTLGLVDCRVHGMNYTILRKTRMTAVQVEPAFISNVKEERLLGSGNYIEAISGAISRGVARFLKMEKQSII